MKLIGVILLALAVGSQCASVPRFRNLNKVGKNGGLGCVGCTAVIAIIEQLVEYRNSTVSKTLGNLCDVFPAEVKQPCKEAVTFISPAVIELIVHNNGPDVVCHALNLCFTEKGLPTCKTISPPWESTEVPFELRVAKAKALIHPYLKKFPKGGSICDIPGIKYLCQWIDRSISDRTPLIDFDKDGFSPSMTFRGSAWRGKDCSDVISNVHPGSIPSGHDVFVDSNCNGIHGINNKTKQAYEDEFCSESHAKGVATLGDSISAHFSLPPVWLDATKISLEAFKHLPLILEDEIDWPMLGSFTGHGTNDWTEVIKGPIDSIYKRMVDRNRCNHRDYQNIAINGEDSFNVHEVMKTLSRDQTLDRPLMLFIVLLGNDVCQGKSQSLDNMTTADEMHKNTLETLDYLNGRLPAGSSVMIIGLADGRPLYETMANRIHPIANYWQKLTYSEFYDYLICLGSSPCPAWLNSNETARDRAAQRVSDLNAALKDIVKERKSYYSNYDLHYIDDPIESVLKDWLAEGGQPWELVEPSDGFHSSQLGQALTSEVIWKYMSANMPEVLGPINPHNKEIKKLFGDQGGL